MFNSPLTLPFILLLSLRAEMDTPIPPPPEVKARVVSQGHAIFEDMCVSCAIYRERYELILVSGVKGKVIIRHGEKMPNTKYDYRLVKYCEYRECDLDKLKAFKLRNKEKDPTKILEPLNAATLPQLLREQKEVLFATHDRITPKDVKSVKSGTIILILPEPKEETKKD